MLVAERAKLAALTIEYDLLKLAYEDLRIKVALEQHRLVVAKAERLGTTQLEIDLGAKLAELDALNRRLGLLAAPLGASVVATGDRAVNPRAADRPQRQSLADCCIRCTSSVLPG